MIKKLFLFLLLTFITLTFSPKLWAWYFFTTRTQNEPIDAYAHEEEEISYASSETICLENNKIALSIQLLKDETDQIIAIEPTAISDKENNQFIKLSGSLFSLKVRNLNTGEITLYAPQQAQCSYSFENSQKDYNSQILNLNWDNINGLNINVTMKFEIPDNKKCVYVELSNNNLNPNLTLLSIGPRINIKRINSPGNSTDEYMVWANRKIDTPRSQSVRNTLPEVVFYPHFTNTPLQFFGFFRKSTGFGLYFCAFDWTIQEGKRVLWLRNMHVVKNEISGVFQGYFCEFLHLLSNVKDSNGWLGGNSENIPYKYKIGLVENGGWVEAAKQYRQELKKRGFLSEMLLERWQNNDAQTRNSLNIDAGLYLMPTIEQYCFQDNIMLNYINTFANRYGLEKENLTFATWLSPPVNDATWMPWWQNNEKQEIKYPGSQNFVANWFEFCEPKFELSPSVGNSFKNGSISLLQELKNKKHIRCTIFPHGYTNDPARNTYFQNAYIKNEQDIENSEWPCSYCTNRPNRCNDMVNALINFGLTSERWIVYSGGGYGPTCYSNQHEHELNQFGGGTAWSKARQEDYETFFKDRNILVMSEDTNASPHALLDSDISMQMPCLPENKIEYIPIFSVLFNQYIHIMEQILPLPLSGAASFFNTNIIRYSDDQNNILSSGYNPNTQPGKWLNASNEWPLNYYKDPVSAMYHLANIVCTGKTLYLVDQEGKRYFDDPNNFTTEENFLLKINGSFQSQFWDGTSSTWNFANMNSFITSLFQATTSYFLNGETRIPTVHFMKLGALQGFPEITKNDNSPIEQISITYSLAPYAHFYLGEEYTENQIYSSNLPCITGSCFVHLEDSGISLDQNNPGGICIFANYTNNNYPIKVTIPEVRKMFNLKPGEQYYIEKMTMNGGKDGMYKNDDSPVIFDGIMNARTVRVYSIRQNQEVSSIASPYVLPDLKVERIFTNYPTRCGFDIHTMLKNSGFSTPSTNFNLKVKADGNVILDTTVNKNSLSPNSYLDKLVNWTPASCGEHTIRAEIDPNNEITERDKINNIEEITVRVLGIDGNPINLHTYGELRTHMQANLFFDIKNSGEAILAGGYTPNPYIRIQVKYLNGSQWITVSNSQYTLSSAIQPNNSINFSHSFFPQNTGTYKATVSFDTTNILTEENEGNNEITLNFNVNQ